MQPEKERPILDKPEFIDTTYDYRNYECAGKFRGIGEAGKTGKRNSDSLNAMPKESVKSNVRRDHDG